MLQERDDIVALDSAILQHPRVWEASGHLEGFTDPLVDCRACKQRFRADHVDPTRCARRRRTCPRPRTAATSSPRRATSTSCSRRSSAPSRRPPRWRTCVRRPRRASSSTSRTSCSSAAASRRSASRRPASRSATRSRRATSSSARASSSRWRWSSSCRRPRRASGTRTGRTSASPGTSDLGIRPDHLRLREHDADELSHYSSGTADVEYLFPIGWSELEGIANRGDFDLTRARRVQRREARVLRPGERRALRAARHRARRRRRPRDARVPRRRLRRGGGRGRDSRTVLRLHPRLAPVKVAVLPLVRKDGQPELAREVRASLRGLMQCRVRRGRLDRPALPAPGRDRHAVVRHDRPPVPAGPHGDDPRPRLARAGARRRSTTCPACSRRASRRRGAPRSSSALELSSVVWRSS